MLERFWAKLGYAIDNQAKSTPKCVLKTFKEKEAALLEFDKKIYQGIKLYTTLWVIGVTNAASNVLASCALVGYCAYHYQYRQELKHEFDKSLSTLLQYYHVFAKSSDASQHFTHQPYFLKMMQALAPYVSTNQLLDFPVKQDFLEKASDEFKKILATLPHRCDELVMLNGKLIGLQNQEKPLTIKQIYNELNSNINTYFYHANSRMQNETKEVIDNIKEQILDPAIQFIK